MTENAIAPPTTFNEHVILAARLGPNASALRQVLEAQAQVQIKEPTVQTVSDAIRTEAALIVLTEEVLSDPVEAKQLGSRLSEQPAWSDIPMIILLTECQRFGACLALLGETTHHRSILLLELPLKRMIFSTIVRACLQNRRRQYTLRDTLFQLKESNQALENFSYTAAHELRNPLGVAKSSFDLLARMSLEPKQQKIVDMGQRTTDRMNQLIGALLDYSKVQSTADEFTTVDMTAVVKEAIDGLQVLIKERQADVTCVSLPTVSGNRPLLIRLMSNLIKNAIIHNTADVPRVAISAQIASASEASTSQNNLSQPQQTKWTFFIADNGPGMPSEIQSEIFDMFNRAGKSRAEGSGIGLALCQRVAQQHETAINVKSQVDGGSTFYFDLASAERD